MSSNTSEYEHAMLAFLLPALMHQLFPTQKDISDLLSRAELDIRRGPENTNEGILVRMVSLEANFNYLRLSVVPTTFVKKDVYDLMKKIYLSEYPIKFSEFDLYRDKEPSSNELLPLAFIAVGRCCRSLGYYVPKLLSENTVLSILSTLHAIMVDRRPRPGAAIGIPRQHQPPSWRPPPHCAVRIVAFILDSIEITWAANTFIAS